MKKFNLIIICIFVLFAGCKQQANSEKDATDTQQTWWKEAIVYQIYPRSFKDSDGDGIGDIRGIIEELDYIKSLDVNAVWLNPIYASPNDDNGYDISDYRAIMKEFGTMQDFDDLLKGLHDRDIKFVMDVVVNHSSDEHQWFQESRKSRDNPYRNYYHWWPAEKGEPNYRWSYFDENGSAWQYDSLTNAYYLHYFSKKQPDLNWENPKVRQEVYDIMKFWADKGVDGFRLDAFQFVSKDTLFPPLPKDYEKDVRNVIKYYGMGDNIHKYLREMNDSVLSKYNVFAVSEGAGSTLEDAHSLVDANRKELQMAYHFEGVDLIAQYNGFSLLDFKENYTKWANSFEDNGWLAIFLANHDKARMVNLAGNPSEEYRATSSKMLNTFVLTMKGTPFCYYGDELGMTNIDFSNISDYQDIAARNGYKKTKKEGGDTIQFLKELTKLSRDNGRTPMQWNTEKNAGFTTGTPWLPVNPNYKSVNVVSESDNPVSVLNYFRKLTKLRSENPALIYGTYELLDKDNPDIYAYTRTLGNVQYLILLNFSEKQAEFNTTLNLDQYEYIFGNLVTDGSSKMLQPYEARILKRK